MSTTEASTPPVSGVEPYDPRTRRIPGPAGVLALRVSVRFGITPAAAKLRVTRWRRRGQSVQDADRVSVMVLGLHPSLV